MRRKTGSWPGSACPQPPCRNSAPPPGDASPLCRRGKRRRQRAHPPAKHTSCNKPVSCTGRPRPHSMASICMTNGTLQNRSFFMPLPPPYQSRLAGVARPISTACLAHSGVIHSGRQCQQHQVPAICDIQRRGRQRVAHVSGNLLRFHPRPEFCNAPFLTR